jgi:hypothetical protein
MRRGSIKFNMEPGAGFAVIFKFSWIKLNFRGYIQFFADIDFPVN